MFTIIAAISLVAYGSSCQPPSLSVQISANSTKPDISEQFSRGELNKMAEESRQPRKHPVLGFFVGTLRYLAEISIENSEGQNFSCPGKLQLRLGMEFREHIGLAKDIFNGACREAALAHYRRHAEAEEAEFTQFAHEVKGAIEREYVKSPLSPAEMPPEQYRTMVLDYTRSLLNRDLARFDARRQAKRGAIDSQGAARALEAACPSST